MSSDPPVSEVSAPTGNSSSKRLLDGECERKEVDTENRSCKDSTNDIGMDVDNPPKRMKVEAIGGEAIVDNNPLNPVDTNHSASTRPPPSQPINCNDENEKGNNGDLVGSGDIASSDTGTNDTGIRVAASHRGNTSESSHTSSPAVTRFRSTSTDEKKDEEVRDDGSVELKARWRVHQIAEDYTSLVGSMMYPSTQFQSYGYNPEQRQYPIEKISLLGFMKSPLRRPTIIEKWSPYEIALFEGSMLHYGKDFRKVSRQIGTKTTQEVIDFYYIWKKTAHYKKWKEQYISDEDLIDDFYIPLKKPKR